MRDWRWRTDKPSIGQVVEVWFLSSVILAVWDGSGWKTVEGNRIAPVTHWRQRCT